MLSLLMKGLLASRKSLHACFLLAAELHIPGQYRRGRPLQANRRKGDKKLHCPFLFTLLRSGVPICLMAKIVALCAPSVDSELIGLRRPCRENEHFYIIIQI